MWQSNMAAWQADRGHCELGGCLHDLLKHGLLSTTVQQEAVERNGADMQPTHQACWSLHRTCCNQTSAGAHHRGMSSGAMSQQILVTASAQIQSFSNPNPHLTPPRSLRFCLPALSEGLSHPPLHQLTWSRNMKQEQSECQTLVNSW
jgi:hypothetical protein